MLGAPRQIVLAQAGTLFGSNYPAGQVLRFTGSSGYSETVGNVTNTYLNGTLLALTNFENYYALYPHADIDPYPIYGESVFSLFPRSIPPTE